MLNWIVWNRNDYFYKNGFGDNKQQMLIYHKRIQPTNLNHFIKSKQIINTVYNLALDKNINRKQTND